MEGWVSIHRQIMDHWIYRESKPFSKREAWFDLILLANHCDTTFPLGNVIIEAKRGQVITSEVKLMERWKWSKTKLRSFLVLLENDQMIVKITDRKKTIISLVNYGNFQVSQTTEKPIKDREETAKEPQKDTINNVNNVNNLINTNLSSSIPGDNPFALFETHKFGKLDVLSRDFIGDTIDTYTEDWVVRAIKETVKSNKIAWKYVEGILARWKSTGHAEPWTLEKVEDKPPQNGNVSRFPYQRAQKQSIPIITPDSNKSNTSTPEELEEMRQRAKRMDEKFNKQVPS